MKNWIKLKKFLTKNETQKKICRFTGIRGKTLWNLVELLGAPAALLFAAFHIEGSIRKEANSIKAENNRQEVLQNALKEIKQTKIAELPTLTERTKDATPNRKRHRQQIPFDPVSKDLTGYGPRVKQTTIRANILTALQQLDGRRKGILITFLEESFLIQKISLAKADLRNANIPFKDLNRTVLKGANLKGADLRESVLQHANLGPFTQNFYTPGKDIEIPTNLSNANLKNTNMFASNLQQANLSNSDLGGSMLKGINLKGANLNNADLRNADLRLANLTNSNLRNADLRHSSLLNSNLRETNIEQAKLKGALYSKKTQFPDGFEKDKKQIHKIAPGENLKGVDMSGFIFNNTDLSKANLTRANLNRTHFSGSPSRFQSAQYSPKFYNEFTGNFFTYPSKKSLKNTYLNGATLRGANIKNATFSDASLVEANLSNADLSNTLLHDSNLEKANLRNANLRKVNLSGANLKNAKFLKRANLEGAIFCETTMPNGEVNNESCDHPDALQSVKPTDLIQ
jgi:uncharacterized protein YjbI with pentapeptide repeats